MKKKDVQIGEAYIVRVSGLLAPVRIVRENPSGGWDGANIRTGHSVRVRSAARLRGVVAKPTADFLASLKEVRT
jgi:hypothetical protein